MGIPTRHIYKGNKSWLFMVVILMQCVCITYVRAQQTENNKLVSPDTAAVNKLLSQAYQSREINPDSAGYLYKKAFITSQSISYRIGMADALCGLGRYADIKNKQKEAVSYLRSALLYCDNSKRGRELFVTAHLLLSDSYYYLGFYDSCALYRYEALDYIENNKMENPVLRLRVYSKILQFWLNAHEDIHNDKYIRQIMESINELEKTALINKDSNLLVNIYFQKEGYYHNISQNDSSRYYALKNLELGRRLKVIPSMLMATYLDIAITYISDKQPQLAILNINKAIAEAPKHALTANRYLIFADIFLGEAYCLQHDYDKAIACIVPALAAAQKLNIMSIQEEAHGTLADAYEGRGDYKNAATQRRLYSIVKDSLMKTEKIEMGYNLDIKYRIAEKDRVLAEKQLDIVRNEIRIRNKNILIMCIATGLLLILIIGLLLFRNSKHKQKLQAESLNTLQREMEINLLKARVSGSEKERSRIARDLHDGVSGTLGSIRAQVGMIFRKYRTEEVSGDFEDVMQLLEEASAEVRKTAHDLMPEILLQEGLVNATALFCERVEKSHSIDLRFSTYGQIGSLTPELELSVYRIIQELVQNILKHAKALHATVQIGFHETQICLTVEDDGVGMDKEAKQKAFGVGLKTIGQRVLALHGTIDIATAPGEGTSIYIELNTENDKT